MWHDADMATREANGDRIRADQATRRPETDQDVGEPLGVVVGENLRRIREERRLTQHEAARMCQAVGLNWSRSRLAGFEGGGREGVDVGTLQLLAAALDVPPADLFAGDGRVRLSALGRQSRAGLRRQLAGPDWRKLPPEDQPEVMRFTKAAVEADGALADRLGVPTNAVVEIAAKLWGRSLTEERDRRVSALGEMEPNERQAHRGHITRELAQEIERLVEGGER